MSIKLMSKVWDLDVDSTSAILLLRICDFATDEGTRIYPSIDRLAHETGVSKSTVKRRIREWKSGGVLRCIRPGGRGAHDTSEYCIDLSMFEVRKPLKEGIRLTEGLLRTLISRDGCTCRQCGQHGNKTNGADRKIWSAERINKLEPWYETNALLVCASCKKSSRKSLVKSAE